MDYDHQLPDKNKLPLTLDEPIMDTVKRDLSNIFIKLKFAMIPSLRQEGKIQLRNWDLWGPLLLSLWLSTTLTIRSFSSEQEIITSVFIILWVGSAVVFLNSYFLGSNMSFFQSVSLLGYCLFPLNLVSTVACFINSWMPAIIKLTLVILSLIWSVLSSTAFLREMVPDRKRKLALYPVGLFYLFISWFLILIIIFQHFVWILFIHCRARWVFFSFHFRKDVVFYWDRVASQIWLLGNFFTRNLSVLNSFYYQPNQYIQIIINFNGLHFIIEQKTNIINN